MLRLNDPGQSHSSAMNEGLSGLKEFIRLFNVELLHFVRLSTSVSPHMICFLKN